MREPHRAHVATLFVDLTGFTSFAETADPEVLFGALQEYRTAMGLLLDEHRGQVIDMVGDGIFAVFNDPVEIADPEYHAILAALAMRERFAPIGERWSKSGDRLGIKLALHAGYATLGRVGYPGHFSYGAVGRTVHTAALMVRALDAGMVAASEVCVSVVRDRVVTRALPDNVAARLSRITESRVTRPIKCVEVVEARRS